MAVPQAAQDRHRPGLPVLRVEHVHGFGADVHRRCQRQHQRARDDQPGVEPGGAPETDRAHGAGGARGEGRGAEVGVIEEPDGHQAAGRGADQIGGVEPADGGVGARQRQRRHDAAHRERDGDHGEHQRQHDHVHRRPFLSARDGDGQRQQVRERHGEREAARPEREVTRGAIRPEAIGRGEDGDGARGGAEHGHRDRDEGEVIPRDHRQEPAHHDLQQQRGEHDEGEACVDGHSGGPFTRVL